MVGVVLVDVGLWMLVGLVVGWLTALTDRSSDDGVLLDVAVGVLGACVGGLLAWLLPVPSRSPTLLTIAAATVGAAGVLAMLRALSSARWHR